MKKYLPKIIGMATFGAVLILSIFWSPTNLANDPAAHAMPEAVHYTGIIRHIFSHSLVVYPEKALADVQSAKGYRENMLTVRQFKEILQQLYDNDFILIDGNIIYSHVEKGVMRREKLYIPKGKKPLILSIDDLAYYEYMSEGGFAHRLVLDKGRVKTEIKTSTGDIAITDDGDIVPIVDSFVREHPDFSLNGAKGIIALTGIEGILGYRVQRQDERGEKERNEVMPVIQALKSSGWTFASHSYSHNQRFLNNTIDYNFLAKDLSLWANIIEPLVGHTDAFIGPFGQIFSEKDPRRQQLIDAGFHTLYGVGMDGYTHFFDDHLVMNRTNLDGYRLNHNPKRLLDIYGISIDPSFN